VVEEVQDDVEDDRCDDGGGGGGAVGVDCMVYGREHQQKDIPLLTGLRFSVI